MSSFGGFGSSGFGSNNNNSNNNTSSAFGGFGSTGTAGGFGSGSAFGSNNSNNNNNSTGLFGGGTSNTGSTFGGFGSNTANNTSSIFGGNKTSAFGSTTSSGGGLFGGTTATSGGSGFGGFGSNASSGFGSSTAFGANKTGFGTSTGSPFGGGGGAGGTSGNAFGSSSNTGFGGGANTSTPFGAGNVQNNGTASMANSQFTPHNEKEPNSTTINYYQSVTAAPQFQKFSAEELRAVDYAQGRKHGNQSGQAGSFGNSSGFGNFTPNNANNNPTAFGSTNPSGNNLFGGSSGNAFGANNATPSTGFGSSTLFGNKPTTNLFGGGTNTSTASSGTNLFGTSGGNAFGGNSNPSTGFGASTSSPFGASTQNKGFGLGSNTANTGSTMFGNQTGGNAFGANNNSGSTLFGGNPSNTTGFGSNTNQQAQPGGTLFGGGFNTQQAKPGLFGNTTNANTGSNLFGGASNTSSGTNLFGATNNQSNTLFGAKPNSSPFGQSNAGTSNLFGGTQAQNPSNTLFGGASQQSTNLFSKPAGSGTLFGSSQAQPQVGGSTMFGASQQQPSAFGTPQAQQAQPTSLLTSLTDSPYGNTQLFASLASPSQSLGPLATPLSSASKPKKQAVIPHHRLMPNSSSRLITPQKRPGGYGFSYSNYNSPASPASNASPYANNALTTSVSRSLGKSLSTSNLRHSFSAQEPIISPNAFQNVVRSGPGSMKKLNINRTVSNRRSLFGSEPNATPLTKKVSFENDTPADDSASPTALSGALVRVEDTDDAAADGINSPTQTNGSTGNELAIVPEEPNEASALEIANRKARLAQKDQTPGGYKFSPTISEIKGMSHEQRSKVKDFTVSREGVGQIIFSQVNFNQVPLEEIAAQIVELELRRATVYGDNSPVKTPPQGEGLNVPSIITLENSWPRARPGRLKVPEKSGAAYEKHIRLLKANKDTKFVSYDPDTGRWVFEVQHYTTYELVYDDDESVADSMMLDNAMNVNQGHQEPSTGFAQSTPFVQGNSSNASSADSLDDTFEFKTGRRVEVPGQFNEHEFFDDDIMEETEPVQQHTPIPVPHIEDDEMLPIPEDDFVAENDQLSLSKTSLHPGASQPLSLIDQDTPTKVDALVLETDWTEQLLQTASPKKRDRHTLKDHQAQPASFTLGERKPLEVNKASTFGTTVDIMKSLFASPSASSGKKSVIEVSKSTPIVSNHRENDTIKSLIFDTLKSSKFSSPMKLDVLEQLSKTPARFSPMSKASIIIPETINKQQSYTDVSVQPGTDVPFAQTSSKFEFSAFAAASDVSSPEGKHESELWELAGILFDDNIKIPAGLQGQAQGAYVTRFRRERLSEFWKKLVQPEVEAKLFSAKSNEERAFLHLTEGNIPDACAALLAGSNFHLAQMVSQIGGDQVFRDTMAKQLDDWLELNVSSEMNDYIRAIYELLAGHTLESKGKTTGGTENKVPSFKLSARFDLDWKRAFGLRLWYGSYQQDDVATAIIQFSSDLELNHEPARPLPWFVLSKHDMGWDDPSPQTREDTLWVLLRMYSDLFLGIDSEDEMSADISVMFSPENTSGNPFDPRLSFQLLSLIRGKQLNFPESMQSQMIATADEFAMRYAACLEPHLSNRSDLFILSCWLLLHMTDSALRSSLIKTLLEHHAHLLVDTDSIGNTLISNLLLPLPWICTAKATYARKELNDPVAEARWLLDGGEIVAAHAVVYETIGPKAVIEGDFARLKEVLEVLNSQKVFGKVDWERGAGLYYDYIELLELQSGSKRNVEAKTQVKKSIKKLCGALEAIAAEGVSEKDIMEKIALKIIAGKVVDIGRREGALELDRVLRLPLSENGYLEQSKTLSMMFYEAQLVSAK